MHVAQVVVGQVQVREVRRGADQIPDGVDRAGVAGHAHLHQRQARQGQIRVGRHGQLQRPKKIGAQAVVGQVEGAQRPVRGQGRRQCVGRNVGALVVGQVEGRDGAIRVGDMLRQMGKTTKPQCLGHQA
jgi:hypothetical protein